MTSPSSPKSKTDLFLAQAHEFHLGSLPTEASHPRTRSLSQLAEKDLRAAISLLQEVEIAALQVLKDERSAIQKMSEEIASVLREGGRIFLCGCGATGRLSLSLEVLWREKALSDRSREHEDSVVSFIAGGDYALLRSIENFEDHPEYGARQLRDLSFSKGDLLISCTEGGETPFVIGATEEASRISRHAPYFLYCNPSDLLTKTVERSRHVIENPAIRKICLETGPMAITGSTRLQASTALMLAVGAALFSTLPGAAKADEQINEFFDLLAKAPLHELSALIESEAAIYSEGKYCLHTTDHYGITVLTDTTERSPTFSLVPFENRYDTSPRPAWTYLCVPSAKSASEAFLRILHRKPRALEWSEYSERFGPKIMDGFDFSSLGSQLRTQVVGGDHQSFFEIDPAGAEIVLRLQGKEARLKRPASLLSEHLLLKVALNISSTLVMGRLGRFSGNLMLYVRSSNNKLIDRSIRFVRTLFDHAGLPQPSYEDTCYALFEVPENLAPGEAAVPKTFEWMKSQRPNQSSTSRG